MQLCTSNCTKLITGVTPSGSSLGSPSDASSALFVLLPICSSRQHRSQLTASHPARRVGTFWPPPPICAAPISCPPPLHAPPVLAAHGEAPQAQVKQDQHPAKYHCVVHLTTQIQLGEHQQWAQPQHEEYYYSHPTDCIQITGSLLWALQMKRINPLRSTAITFWNNKCSRQFHPG